MAKDVHNAPWEKAFDHLLTPLEEFIHRQNTSGVLLMIFAVVALPIANSPLQDDYEHWLHTELGLNLGGSAFSMSLPHWINEAIMAMFFLVIGLELKRELLQESATRSGLTQIEVRRAMPYAVVGVLLWTAMLASGSHSTIAGIGGISWLLANTRKTASGEV